MRFKHICGFGCISKPKVFNSRWTSNDAEAGLWTNPGRHCPSKFVSLEGASLSSKDSTHPCCSTYPLGFLLYNRSPSAFSGSTFSPSLRKKKKRIIWLMSLEELPIWAILPYGECSGCLPEPCGELNILAVLSGADCSCPLLVTG